MIELDHILSIEIWYDYNVQPNGPIAAYGISFLLLRFQDLFYQLNHVKIDNIYSNAYKIDMS